MTSAWAEIPIERQHPICSRRYQAESETVPVRRSFETACIEFIDENG
jgi:hypothetical protein